MPEAIAPQEWDKGFDYGYTLAMGAALDALESTNPCHDRLRDRFEALRDAPRGQTVNEAPHDDLRSRPLIYDGHLADSIALDAESRAPLSGTIPPIEGSAAMTLDELVAKLHEIARPPVDPERAHGEADAALLDYIGDANVTAAFEAVPKWYS